MEQNTQNVAPDSIGAELGTPQGGSATRIQQKWLKRISEERKCHRDFRKRSKDVQDIFQKQGGF